jgi:two-component system sensor histidine kinase HydH
MNLHDYPTRFLIAATTASLLLLGLCGALAAALNAEQSRTAGDLSEDLRSRTEAANLEETLENLAALHDRGVRSTEPILNRVEEHLAAISQLANKNQERAHVRAVTESYRGYLRLCAGGKPDAETLGPAQYLRERTIPACRQLRHFNASESEASEEAHHQALRRMSWGLAVVGGLGSIGGLLLGYGLARGLRQTIHQFLIRVQGAADRLGQELPAIEWQRVGPAGDGADDLLSRVEQAVVKLQQQEREVRRAERLAAVGQLAAGIAHEVRNPLTAAILLIQTGRRDPSAGELTDEDLGLIEGELHRIESTLQTFLDFARPPKPERVPCDVAAVVRDVLALARGRASQQRVEVRLEAPPAGCVLDADREQLRQVVLNLVLNALDVMPCGGALSVRLVPGGGGGAELTVSDSGPGISADMFPRLFQPFATNKDTGLGLGLVVSRRIVEDHGGSIHAVNGPQGGATFVVRLPARLSQRGLAAPVKSEGACPSCC